MKNSVLPVLQLWHPREKKKEEKRMRKMNTSRRKSIHFLKTCLGFNLRFS